MWAPGKIPGCHALSPALVALAAKLLHKTGASRANGVIMSLNPERNILINDKAWIIASVY